MKYRKTGLLIMVLVFCLAMTQIAGANAVVKTLYVDGSQVNRSVASPQDLSYLFNRLTIGCEGSQWYQYLGVVGQIDDFSVYSGILGGDRISAHYAANSTAGVYEANVADDSPLLYLKFQDTSSANGAVAANSGTSAELSGRYLGAITLVPGRFSDANAANLRGATGGSGDCIDVGDTNGVISLGTVTIECWVRLDTNVTTGYPRLFQHNNGDAKMGSYGAMLSLGTNAIGVIGGGSTNYFTMNLNDDGWHQIVITYNSVVTSPEKSYPSMILGEPNLRAYLRFEGETQMEALEYMWHWYFYYKDFLGEVTEYDLNRPASLNYGDTAEGGRTISERAGGIGSSIFFDNTPVEHSIGIGLDSHAAISTAAGAGNNGWSCRWGTPIADDANFAFAIGDITYEFWFKHAPPDRHQISRFDVNDTNAPVGTFFQQIGSPQDGGDGATNEPNAPGIGLEANSIRILCGVRIPRTGNPNDTNTTAHWYPGKQLPPTDQQWHQLVLVYDVNASGDVGNDPNVDHYNSMVVRFYFDGVLFNSITAVDPCGQGHARMGPWLNHLTIGSDGDNGFGYNGVAGYIDEFAIYAGCLDPDRILAHYAAWQPITCEEFKGRGYGIPEDIDKDCDVDFRDFAAVALNWASCNEPNKPGCTPNW